MFACCPSETIAPKETIDDEVKSIIPKYDNDDSEKMTLGTINTDEVTNVPAALGKICLNINLPSLAPKVREAKTYS